MSWEGWRLLHTESTLYRCLDSCLQDTTSCCLTCVGVRWLESVGVRCISDQIYRGLDSTWRSPGQWILLADPWLPQRDSCRLLIDIPYENYVFWLFFLLLQVAICCFQFIFSYSTHLVLYFRIGVLVIFCVSEKESHGAVGAILLVLFCNSQIQDLTETFTRSSVALINSGTPYLRLHPCLSVAYLRLYPCLPIAYLRLYSCLSVA